MNYKPNEKDWMAYLYGELEGDEKDRFEQYLIQNPEAQKQLAGYHNLRSIMSAAEDKEVIAPPILFGEPKRSFFDTPYIKTIFAVAASLLLVILVGKLAGIQMRASGNEFVLTFGEQVQRPVKDEPVQPVLTEQQVREMINTSLENNHAELQATLKESEQKLTASIRKNLAANSGRIDQLVRHARG